jgi:phosphoribosyl-ATP pyrophosphohydrolase
VTALPEEQLMPLSRLNDGFEIELEEIAFGMLDRQGHRWRCLITDRVLSDAIGGAPTQKDKTACADHPRTFKLLQSSRHKVTRKLIEEACEVTVEAFKRDPAGVVRESADLLYHLVVLWFHIGIEPTEIWEEMKTRANALGIAEKRPKTAIS